MHIDTHSVYAYIVFCNIEISSFKSHEELLWKSNVETFTTNIIVPYARENQKKKKQIPDELTTVTSAPKSYRKCEIIANVTGIEITHTQRGRADK